jgi:ABC-type uncharacterized transport system permease subunit
MRLPARLAMRLLPLGVSIAVVLFAFLVGLLMIALTGNSATEAAQAIWDGAFGDDRQIVSTLTKMVPLTLVGLGWVLAFSARRINVGLEGQILAGGILTTVVGLHLTGVPHVLHVLLAVLAGALGGALWAGIAAWLWARRSVSDLVSTLMLNFVAIQLVAWLIRGPLRESGDVLAQTDSIAASARYGDVSSNALTLDVILLPVLVVAVLLLLTRTTFGFRVRLTGANPEAARHAGVDVKRVGATVLVLSGLLAGLAGSSLLLAGDTDVMSDNFSAGIGFEGIAVALLARNSPIGCIPAALLFAVLDNGGSLMETRVGVPSSMVLVMQGLVIVIAASTDPLLRRVRDAVRRRKVAVHHRPAEPSVPALEEA